MRAFNRITAYQSSFRINNLPASEAAASVKKYLWTWIKDKETLHRLPTGKRVPAWGCEDVLRWFEAGTDEAGLTSFELFSEGKLRKEKVGIHDNQLNTLMCRKDNSIIWGMEYFEFAHGRKRSDWLTEIGITEFIEDETDEAPSKKYKGIVFYICVSYVPKDAFADEPKPTVPRLLYSMLSEGSGLKAYALDALFPFDIKPKKVADEEHAGERFTKFVLSPSRRYPIIALVLEYVSEETISFIKNLARRLLGKTIFFVINPRSKCTKTISLPKQLHANTLYLIHPVVQTEAPRMESYGLVKLDDLEDAIAKYIYRHQTLPDPEAVTPGDVRQALRIEKMAQKYEAEQRGLKDKCERINKELEDLTDSSNQSIQRVEHDRDEWKSKYDKLYAQYLGVTAGKSRQAFRSREEQLLQIVEQIVRVTKARKTLRCQVEALTSLFEEHLIITDNAVKALDNAPNGFDLRDALIALVVLDTRLYPTYGSSLGGHRELALDGFPIEYSANEGANTKTSSVCSKERTVRVGGKSYVCWEHLKLQTHDARVYFAYSEELKKIIVCSIGPHLTTAGTKRKGL